MQKPRNNARDILMDNTKNEKNKIFLKLIMDSPENMFGRISNHREFPDLPMVFCKNRPNNALDIYYIKDK